MTDLHSHILPGMDDGAPDMETALQLLKFESEQGVSNIALTSHFNCENTSISEFLTRRTFACSCLKEKLKESGMEINLKSGSEVFFSPDLLKMDLHDLCIEETDILLLELSVNYRPQFFKEILSDLQSEGIIPLIAHVERYPYVMENPSILVEWIEAGAYMQMNAGALLRNNFRKKVLFNLIKWGLVHVIASDTHSLNKRPPRMKQALEIISQKIGRRAADQMKMNADGLFNGIEPKIESPYRPRHLGLWWY